MAITFRDLAIWRKAYELVVEIYAVTKAYPVEERYGLTSQTRNSANSVTANIAESHGRFHYADKVRVLYQPVARLKKLGVTWRSRRALATYLWPGS
ncbi:four helix bundle protein [Candidatus Berkelbacteria bacterium]|nr:four helix bundle protein [Candidatus Berkelbacteria bacterium]